MTSQSKKDASRVIELEEVVWKILHMDGLPDNEFKVETFTLLKDMFRGGKNYTPLQERAEISNG